MLRSVVAMSDVHGVLPVLEAVLAEPAVGSADLIVVTGDHAAGPQPVEVLDRLTGLGSRCLLVRGHADPELVSIARGGGSGHPATGWGARETRERQVHPVGRLPPPAGLGW